MRLLLFFFVLISYIALEKLVGEDKIHPDCSNYILISGESNVNEFELVWQKKSSQIDDQNFARESGSGEIIINIPVEEFKARNSLMYKDFLEMMKAGKFPEIRITIPLEEMSKPIESENIFYPEILIRIAGIENEYRVACIISRCTGSSVHIDGSESIRLTDFGISPPQKFGGLIQVKNEIRVNFRFLLTFNKTISNIL